MPTIRLGRSIQAGGVGTDQLVPRLTRVFQLTEASDGYDDACLGALFSLSASQLQPVAKYERYLKNPLTLLFGVLQEADAK